MARIVGFLGVDFIFKDVFVDILVQNNKKVISFPFSGYWLDVGKHEDFEKAQQDINNIKF